MNGYFDHLQPRRLGEDPEQLWQRDDARQGLRVASAADTPYGLAALRSEADEVRSAVEGTRNDRLNRAWFAAGRLVAGQQLTVETARAALHEAALASGLDQREIASVLRDDETSALLQGAASPRSPAGEWAAADVAFTPLAPATELEEGTSTRPWQPIDLSEVLSGSWEPPQATVGRRSDQVGLFYPGKSHTIASESEAGKTWLVLSASIDEITDGNHVLYLDFEDNEAGVVGRLLGLQLSPEAIKSQFHYLRPDAALGRGINRDDLRRTIAEFRPTLCVIDGVTEAMTLHDLDPLNNKDVAGFGRMLPRAIAEAGAAVVCLDHVVKSSENRGRYAMGGVHKLNGLDGAAFVLENRKPFGDGLTGVTSIRLAKDRPGQLRKHGLPNKDGMVWFGDLKMTSHSEGWLEVEIVPPESRVNEPFRPTALMAEICRVLEEHGPLSAAKIEALVKGKATTIRQARLLLQVEKYVTDSTPHELLKPWGGESND
jgi:hypothetical protein